MPVRDDRGRIVNQRPTVRPEDTEGLHRGVPRSAKSLDHCCDECVGVPEILEDNVRIVVRQRLDIEAARGDGDNVGSARSRRRDVVRGIPDQDGLRGTVSLTSCFGRRRDGLLDKVAAFHR